MDPRPRSGIHFRFTALLQHDKGDRPFFLLSSICQFFFFPGRGRCTAAGYAPL